MSIFRNIRELLRSHGAECENTALAATEITAHYPNVKTSFALHIMHRDGQLGRDGLPRAYRYWLAREPEVRKVFKTDAARAANRAKQEEKRRRRRGVRPMAEYRAEQAAGKAARLAREAAEKEQRQAKRAARKAAKPRPKPKPAPAPRPVAKPKPAKKQAPVRASATRPASQQPTVKRRRKGQDIVIPPNGYATPAPQPEPETVEQWMARTGKKPERVRAVWEGDKP